MDNLNLQKIVNKILSYIWTLLLCLKKLLRI